MDHYWTAIRLAELRHQETMRRLKQEQLDTEPESRAGLVGSWIWTLAAASLVMAIILIQLV